MLELTALQDLLLFEYECYVADYRVYVPSRGEKFISPTAVIELCGLPNLKRFIVMGSWVDLGRREYEGNYVTEDGHIVLRTEPYGPRCAQDFNQDQHNRADELRSLQDDFDSGNLIYHVFLVLDVLDENRK